MTDWLRLAFGTLTAVRVPPPRVVNRTVAARAMLAAPLVGLCLGLVTEGAVLVVRLCFPESAKYVIAALVALTLLALLTRGLHLDGLADTADALGSGRRGADALAVMRRGDVGPFGVITLVLVLLLDAAGLALAISTGRGTLALVGGMVVSRLALAWTAREGIPAARNEGLGAAVAGVVRPWPLVAVTALVVAVLAAMTVLDDDLTVGFVPHTLVAAALALGVSQLLVARAVRRSGGVTGDVMGAAVEVCFCVFVLAVAAGWQG